MNIKKTIRVMSIISIALIGLSLLLVVASFPLQRVLVNIIYGGEYLERFVPQFPVEHFLSLFLMLIPAFLFFIFLKKEENRIWVEVVTLGLLFLVVPSCVSIFSSVYIRIIDGEYFMSYTTVRTISGYFCFFSSLGQLLLYVTCGMSIATKKQNKGDTFISQ